VRFNLSLRNDSLRKLLCTQRKTVASCWTGKREGHLSLKTTACIRKFVAIKKVDSNEQVKDEVTCWEIHKGKLKDRKHGKWAQEKPNMKIQHNKRKRQKLSRCSRLLRHTVKNEVGLFYNVVYRAPATGMRSRGTVHRQPSINNKLAPKPTLKPNPNPNPN